MSTPPPPRSPYFFKVFFPELSAERLKIPPPFMKHIQGCGSRNVASLKGPGGGIWYTDLISTSGGDHFFETGWKEFAHDHTLHTGDFLVFRYEGNLHFDVLVFDTTACEKAAAFTARPAGDTRTERGSTGEEDCPKGGLDTTIWEKESAFTTRPSGDTRTEWGSAGEEDGPKVFIVTPDGIVIVMPNRKRGHEDVIMSEGPASKKPYCCKEVAEVGLPSRKATLRPSLSKKLNKSTKTAASVLPSQVPQTHLKSVKSEQTHRRKAVVSRRKWRGLISQRRPVTLEELDMVFEKAKAFKSDYPAVIVQMCDSYVYNNFFLNIPRYFVKHYIPHDKTKLILWDPKGKRWEVKFVSYAGTCGFIAGWFNFSYENNLEAGDLCAFELIEEDEMRVHIFRVVEEVTPLVRSPSRRI